jgi:hypothetical protein
MNVLAAAAVVITCANVDDTAAIQKAVDVAPVVQLVGNCKVNGNAGVRIPSARTLQMDGAIVRLVPGCARPGMPCRIFETVIGSGGIRLEGGEIVGDFVEVPTATGYSIGVRVDTSAPLPGERWSVVIDGTTFRAWRSDAVYVGGNTPSRGVRLTGVTMDNFGRNGLSVTHADDVSVERLTCRNAKVGTSPGACVDVESNPGERVTRFQAFDVDSSDVEVCFYMHKHSQAQQQGFDYGVYRSRCTRARRYGLILNSAIRSVIVGNVITETPIGVSIGSFTEGTRAANTILSNNTIASPRPIVLSGIRDSSILGNDLAGGRIEAPGLGSSGDMIVTTAPLPPTKIAPAAPIPKQPKGSKGYPPPSQLSAITAPNDPFGLLKQKD